MRYRITCPEPNHTGGVGRLMFVNSQLELDGATHPQELAYLRSTGAHSIEPLDDEARQHEDTRAKLAEQEAERIKAEAAAEQASTPASRLAAMEKRLAELEEEKAARDAADAATSTKASRSKAAASTEGGAQ